jgi:hypothetical protein
LTIVEDKNPFQPQDPNQITKKLDFSRLSNPNVTLFRGSDGQKTNNENINSLNQPVPATTTYNAPLTHLNYQQTFEVKPSANVINIFTGNIDDYIKQIAQIHPMSARCDSSDHRPNSDADIIKSIK